MHCLLSEAKISTKTLKPQAKRRGCSNSAQMLLKCGANFATDQKSTCWGNQCFERAQPVLWWTAKKQTGRIICALGQSSSDVLLL